MAASQIDIANIACFALGLPRLTSLADDREEAEIIASQWNNIRDAELRAHGWRFAIERTTITVDSTAPNWGFTRQFTLPGDCMRVLQMGEVYIGANLSDYRNSDTALYRIEGDKVLTSETGSLKLRYITNSRAIGLWDPTFAEAFGYRLARFLCARKTESSNKKAEVEKEYAIAIRNARRANAIEAPPDALPDDSWILSRL